MTIDRGICAPIGKHIMLLFYHVANSITLIYLKEAYYAMQGPVTHPLMIAGKDAEQKKKKKKKTDQNEMCTTLFLMF